MKTRGSCAYGACVPPFLLDALSIVPPWLLLAALLGLVNGAACFMLLGRRLPHLAWYIIIGALAAGVGQVAGQAIQAPAPIQIGEVNVLAASLLTWGVLGTARTAGL